MKAEVLLIAEALSHSIPVILNSEGGAAEIVNDSCSVNSKSLKKYKKNDC